MAAINLIILLLPAFVLSEIKVRILVNQNQPVDVRLSGSHDEYLNNQDRELFQIRGHELEQAVFMLSGALPYYVEVGYPYGNVMHSNNSWDSVRRKVVPIESKIISKEAYEVKVDRGDPRSDFDLSIRNEWDPASWQLMFGEPIIYDFSLVQGNFDVNYKNRTVVYTRHFNEGGGWNSGLRTGRGVSRIRGNELYATKMLLKIEVKYELSLYGCVACKFNQNLNGSYHWCYDVNACLIKAGRPTKIYVSEVIKVVFFYDEVFERASNLRNYHSDYLSILPINLYDG